MGPIDQLTFSLLSLAQPDLSIHIAKVVASATTTLPSLQRAASASSCSVESRSVVTVDAMNAHFPFICAILSTSERTALSAATSSLSATVSYYSTPSGDGGSVVMYRWIRRCKGRLGTLGTRLVDASDSRVAGRCCGWN